MPQRTTHTCHPPSSNPTTELISSIPPRLTHVASPFPIPTEHISLPAFATNPAGAKVWAATYQPFGEVRTPTGTPIALRFPGQWFQSESVLHQNWMRDYDPTTGRYLEADPLGLVDGASIYGYVKGNPGRWVDRRGLYCSYYSRQDGTAGINCPGPTTYCPSGDCAIYSPDANDRELGQCMDECSLGPEEVQGTDLCAYASIGLGLCGVRGTVIVGFDLVCLGIAHSATCRNICGAKLGR